MNLSSLPIAPLSALIYASLDGICWPTGVPFQDEMIMFRHPTGTGNRVESRLVAGRCSSHNQRGHRICV